MKVTSKRDSCTAKGNIDTPGDMYLWIQGTKLFQAFLFYAPYDVYSGAEYVGDFWYGLMHGLGSLRHSSGDLYEGRLVIDPSYMYL